ncbi:MAG: UDP-3-O-(3-hydroxymyristoyl)glucosamine N-acyltransferase, partial [Candidatus Hydrogenedentes bacterium]|nr:UDP-3-O-(3-hydroxymyristoyl)glucosamine N-acyltransferase [Candidatus Hydrogenedentota bacterium]
MNATLGEIAALVKGTVVGDSSVRITGLNGIREAVSGELTFVSDRKYLPYLETTSATAVVVSRDVSVAGIPLIQVDDPRQAMLTILLEVQSEQQAVLAGTDPTAWIAPTAKIGAGAAIGPNVVIEDGTTIGDSVSLHSGCFIGRSSRIGPGSVLYPNVTVRERVTVGARCLIHSGAVIGSDGFGFTQHGKRQIKIPQVGTVNVGDDVEIGANTAIDRATFGVTVIGDGTKIDNLVQIGHNVRIGTNCIICGNAGLAGSAVLGNTVTIGAGSGVVGHIELADGV